MYNWNVLFDSIEDYKDIEYLSCVYILVFDKGYYYIGSTKNLQERLKKHTSHMSQNKHENTFMQNVFNANNMMTDVKIIEVDEEDRLTLEDYLIKKCFPDDKCCNLNDSAFSPPICTKTIYQYSIDGEYIQKWDSVTDASKALKISTGQLSDVANGNTFTAKGFRWSYVKQDKLSELKYSDFMYGIFDNWICQYTLDGYFIQKYKNVKEASISLGCTYTTRLLACFDNFEKTAQGFRWKRVKKEDIIPIYIPVSIPTTYKKILQISKDGSVLKVWDSAKEAASVLGYRRQDHIHRVCSGKRETFIGFKWRYE